MTGPFLFTLSPRSHIRALCCLAFFYRREYEVSLSIVSGDQQFHGSGFEDV